MATKPTGKGRGASPERMREITRARAIKRAQAAAARVRRPTVPSFSSMFETTFKEWFAGGTA